MTGSQGLSKLPLSILLVTVGQALQVSLFLFKLSYLLLNCLANASFHLTTRLIHILTGQWFIVGHRVVWDAPNHKYSETGVDVFGVRRGVLFFPRLVGRSAKHTLLSYTPSREAIATSDADPAIVKVNNFESLGQSAVVYKRSSVFDLFVWFVQFYFITPIQFVFKFLFRFGMRKLPNFRWHFMIWFLGTTLFAWSTGIFA